EFYQFLTTDAAVPAKIRATMAELGLCRDEFPETDHWSPQLYVREGRRMDGRYTLTQKDVIDDPKKDDAIAISSFPIDSHDCRRIALPDGVINEGTIMPVRIPGRRHGYAYHVPYRAITPATSECTNLLVPVALSATHVAYSSIRVEPTWMTIGQSAGIAAALAAKAGVSVQALDYAQLRARLLAQHQVLDLPVLPPLTAKPAASVKGTGIAPASLPGLILDDAQAELSGEWERSTNFKPHVGTGYLHDEQRSDGKSRAVFRFKVPADGEFELRMAYSAHPTRTTRLPVTLTNGPQVQTFTVDQTIALPSGDAFRTIGTVRLRRDGDYVLEVTNKDTGGFAIVDAFQLLPLATPTK
ncbi:MAG: Xanthan lyase precursor, partial [Verrucomicrobiota bacterium]